MKISSMLCLATTAALLATPVLAQDSLQNAGTASGAGSTALAQSAAVAAALPVGSVVVGSVVVGGSAVVGGSTVVAGGASLAQGAHDSGAFGTTPLPVDRRIVLSPQPAPVVPHDAQAAPTAPTGGKL